MARLSLMIIFSASSSVIFVGSEILSLSFTPLIEGGKSLTVISDEDHITTALSTQFRSCLMFPGQS